MKHLKFIIAALMLLLCQQCLAQQTTTMPYGDFFEKMPVPAASLREMMEAKHDNEVTGRKMAAIYKTIDANISTLYQPVYERFKKAGAGNASLSKAEQDMMTSMKQGTNGLSEALRFDMFKTLMKKRPWWPMANHCGAMCLFPNHQTSILS